MRPSSTIALLVTSVILWGVIWWIDREPEGNGGLSNGSDAGAALLRLTPESIGRLVIKRPGGETVAEKRDGYWFFVEPVEDRADPEAMDALLDQLSHLTVLDQIPVDDLGSSEELNPEALGLTGDQVIRVELTPDPVEGSTDPAGPTQVILVGNPTPLSNSVYARVPDSKEQPDIVDGNPRSYLDDPVAALRDRHLFLAPIEEIVQVMVKTPRGEIEVTRKITPPETDWALTRPLESRANRDKVDELLSTLSGLRVDSVVSSGELPGPPPNPLPDGSLALELRRYGVETPLVIYFSPARDQPDDVDTAGQLIEARVSDRPAVFNLRSDILKTLPSTPNALRDPHLASIPIQSVFGIDIESRGNPKIVLRTARTQGAVGWYSTRNGVAEPANVTQVVELIQAINNEQIISFVSDSSSDLEKYNLSPPPVQIAVSHYERIPAVAPDGAKAGGGGELGATRKILQLGYQQIEGDPDGRYRMFANFVGEPFIYEISPTFQEKVPTHPLKWKDLKLLSFNPISLRSIERKEADTPSILLTYDYRRNDWKATREGEAPDGASSELNTEAARKLLDTLGSLTASSWMIPSPQAYQALEEPDAEFEITLETVDRATGKVGPVTHTLQFAKTSAAIYYGRLDDSQEVFVIDRTTYRDLIMPLFGEMLRPPPN